MRTTAGDAWRDEAREALWVAASQREQITSDDVWRGLRDRGVPPPDEPRLMSAVMRVGRRDGIIADAGRMVVNAVPATHRHKGRAQRLYRSLIFGRTSR